LKREKRIARRYFLFTFATAFLFFSTLFLGVMLSVHPEEAEATGIAASIDEDYKPDAEDSLTVLFLGTRTESGEPGVLILARFDPAGTRVPILALHPRTAVLNNGEWEPLAEVYAYGGAAYARDMLKATMSIPIDRYVVMDYEDFLAAAGIIGAVEFELSEALTLEQDGFVTELSAGRQLIDGAKAGALLSDGSGSESLELKARLAAEIVNQRMDIALSAGIDDIFGMIVNRVDTDISYMDFYERKQAAAWLAERKNEPAIPMTPSGSWNAAGTLFTMADTFLAEAALRFG
jgi:hypothetical protein